MFLMICEGFSERSIKLNFTYETFVEFCLLLDE